MKWTPIGKELPTNVLGILEPIEILVDFEGPRSFLALDPTGELLFAHQCGESDDAWRYAVVPFTEELRLSLIDGRIDIFSALSQPRLWLVDISPVGEVINCFSSKLDSIPTECQPQHGVTLYPEHEPLLSLRATGSNVEIGRANISLIHDQLGNARTGLRLLAEAALGVKTRGQPAKAVRRYYDLPALLLAGSVQVSIFPPPQAGQQLTLFSTDETWSQMQSLLEAGLLHISGKSGKLNELDPATAEAVLKAIYAFSPPTRGEITETEISGQLVSYERGIVHINRTTRSEINRQLQTDTERTPQVFEREGIINELDLEEGTCLLRDDNSVVICKLRFIHNLQIPEPLFEIVKQVFDSGEKVKVVAVGYSLDEDVFLVTIRPLGQKIDIEMGN